MYIVTIRKTEERRSGGDRRKSKAAAATSVRRTVDLSRRKVSDRRSGEDRRKATTYELADDQKPTLDRIVGMLERSISENLGNPARSDSDSPDLLTKRR